jgi:DNA repair protein RadC
MALRDADKLVRYGHRSRLREKFLRSEFACFCPHEIVELLLTLSIPRKDVKLLAKTLLKTFGSIRKILDANTEELMQITGVGQATIVSFKMIRAINSLYLYEKIEQGTSFDSVEKACELWKNRLSNLQIEVVEVAYLDSSLRLVKNGIERLETGTITMTTIRPRRIAEFALRNNSTAIIIAHNHPAGSAEPSYCDERNTKMLQIALKYLEIRLIDHIIVSKNETFSFKQNGVL